MSSLVSVMASIVLGITPTNPPTTNSELQICIEDPEVCRGAIIRYPEYRLIRIVYEGQQPRACETTVESVEDHTVSFGVIDLVTTQRDEWILFIIQWSDMIDENCRVR